MQLTSRFLFIGMMALLGLMVFSCSKKDSAPTNPCAGVTVVVSAVPVSTSGPGLSDGSIAAMASGGSGFTYSLNGGAFQTSGTFAGLVAGAYTITAKNSNGCTGSASFTVATGDPCVGKTITISLAKINSDPCAPNGSVTVSASGSTGFMYKLNTAGTYQASNQFLAVPAGNHTIFVKDGAGCEKTSAITVDPLPNGPLFTAVATLLRNKCANCHTNGVSNGGASFVTDCGIANLKDRIKSRAVDIGDMPQGGSLTNAEKKTITDWVTAGGLTSK